MSVTCARPAAFSRRAALLGLAATGALAAPGLSRAAGKGTFAVRHDPRIAMAAPDLAAFLAAETADMSRQHADRAGPEDVTVTETARAITPRLVSVLRRIERDEAGRAGVWFEPLTWDLQMQDFVLLDALVSPDGAGHAAVRGIAQSLSQTLISRGFARETVAMATPPDPLSLQNFTLEPSRTPNRVGGIAFFWGPHELGAPAKGPQQVTIPQDAFRSGLNETYLSQFSGAPLV